MSAADAVVLSVAGLRKSYGDNEVVRGLDFAIARGECFGLLGPNGAGKTTTLRCCLGLTDPNAGSIMLVGEPVPEAARRTLGQGNVEHPHALRRHETPAHSCASADQRPRAPDSR
jgi:ABC-type multidrug transport system ATPase subunit